MLCWLILVWMLLWGNVSAANILSGLAIALVITVLMPLPPVPIEGRLHPLSLLRLVVKVVYYLVLSSLQVAWLAIRPGPPPRTAVLRAHLALKSDLVLALAVNVINLIPGLHRAGDRPDPADDLRPRHRRGFRTLGEPVLPPGRGGGAADDRVVRATSRLAAVAGDGRSSMNTVWVIAGGTSSRPPPSSRCSGCSPGPARWTGWSRSTPSSRSRCAPSARGPPTAWTPRSRYSLTALALISFVGSVSVARFRVRDTDRNDGNPQ